MKADGIRELVTSVGTFLTIWLLVIGVFWFLFEALLDTATASLSENAEGLIVGGCLAILTMIAQYVTQSAVQRSASRAAIASATQAANAALSTPGAPIDTTPQGRG